MTVSYTAEDAKDAKDKKNFRLSSILNPPRSPRLLRFNWPVWFRKLWRRLQVLRKPLVWHRHRRLVVERVGNASFIVLPDVFNPALFTTSEFLVNYLSSTTIPAGRVLDMGTGSGVGAIFAARWASRVVAVDINPEAVRCVRLNALLNGVEDRVEARQGDLFDPVQGERFDLVLFNPPYFPGRPVDLYDHAWRSEDAIPRFLHGLAGVLMDSGSALVVVSSDVDEAQLVAQAAIAGLTIEIAARQDLIYEIVTILRLQICIQTTDKHERTQN